MTPAEIRAAIAASPALLALARATPADTQGIADALSEGRTRVVAGPVITTRGAAAKFPAIPPLPGPLAFEAALMALEAFAAAGLQQSENPAQLLTARAVKRQLASFDERGLDFGDPVLRGMLDSFVQTTPPTLTQAQADGLKSLANEADPIPEMDVRRAIFADDGSLLV